MTSSTSHEDARSIGSSLSTSHQGFVRFDLYRGHPNNHALPSSEMQSIMSSLLNGGYKDSLTNSLQYGDCAGNNEIISALRSFLDRRTINDVKVGDDNTDTTFKSEFFITNGVSHGIELLCSTCTNRGDEVWMERPTYFYVPEIFKSHGLVIKSLPMMSDREGEEYKESIGQVDLDRLIAMVECDGVIPPKVMYIIPSYHNPTGRSMTVEERTKLASFAIRNNILLVADEVYHLLDWDRDKGANSNVPSARPPSMARFNSKTNTSPGGIKPEMKGCCISVSSFTKIFAPGVRVGWIEAPPHIIDRLSKYGYISSQGGVAPFMGRLMAHAIDSGLLDQYLDKLVLEYSERFNIMCNALKDEPLIKVLTKSSDMNREGGYFIWVQFPSYVDSEEFAAYGMQEFGVRFMTGKQSDPFHMMHNNATKQSIRSCARLCFADLDKVVLVQAINAFIEAFRSFSFNKRSQ